MSQAIAQSELRSTGKLTNIILWVLQVFAAFMFLMAAVPKLKGDPMMVSVFQAIGIGQWFRYLTGGLEAVGALLMLVPALSGLGASLLVVVMIGAVAAHLFILGGSPLMAVILLVVTAIIAWGRRDRTFSLLGF